ncbi:MAG: formyltransferase family protein [Anaerolineales bacterium]
MTLRHASGEPRYKGLRAVRQAVFAGETETRATTHLVTSALDGGPPLLRSWSFPIAPLVPDALAGNDVDILKAYAFAHREWMIRTSWGPLLRRSIELMALGWVRAAGERLTIDGLPGPWELADTDAEPQPRSHTDTYEVAAS